MMRQFARLPQPVKFPNLEDQIMHPASDNNNIAVCRLANFTSRTLEHRRSLLKVRFDQYTRENASCSSRKIIFIMTHKQTCNTSDPLFLKQYTRFSNNIYSEQLCLIFELFTKCVQLFWDPHTHTQNQRSAGTVYKLNT